MIIDNGTITPMRKQGGGFDAKTRQPIAPRLIAGTPIACQYSISEDRQGRDISGNPTAERRYTVLVAGEYNDAESVRLTSASGSVLIDSTPIRSIEYLRAVDQTRIVL